ncbi:hypothetical protein [Rufibacter quisquiliarum]|uniref:Lipoprotein n=1 Tax=Rufibacter quisquiliarum TaxID=1549639 RepID=A0A839GTG5_9BACT|nr:hypothetical protein [Rufibacter quisquiliarum]MBA9078167.1 hypothetical protein [Rufibacter quisquiliarum]
METFWSSFWKNRQKTGAAVIGWLGLGLAVACTSARDNPVLESSEPQRVYRATPTVRDMNEQSSDINRKQNIENRDPNAPANEPPAVRSQQILPGRQPVRVDTASTRTRRDTLRRRQ